MQYKICKKCVMDVSDPDIVFDEKGVCNHCLNAQKMLSEIEDDKANFLTLCKKIETMGRSHKYDVLIGLSGGVDSSMALHYAVQLGLRPLCFSIDNGWNTPESESNIHNLIETLKVPFFRYQIDQQKFNELQTAYVRAGVANLEVPTDHILMASTYEVAAENGIKWIVSGGNVATESIMPVSWGYNARDLVNIKAIYGHFTGKRLKGLPMCSLLKYNYYLWIKRIKILYILDYFNYNRADSIKLLKKLYHYKPYGEKHCENKFTDWFQNEYLIERGIDKKRAHYSSLINSGQMKRETALFKLKNTKLGKKKFLSTYKDYPNDEYLYNKICKFVKLWK